MAVCCFKSKNYDRNKNSEKEFDEVKRLQMSLKEKVDKIQDGDELLPGVLKMVKVFVAVKRKLQPGN